MAGALQPDTLSPGSPKSERVRPTRSGPISAKIFVGNLNFKTTSTELESHLSAAGQIVDVYLPSDRATGRPRGFAFVEFSTEEEAAAAIEQFNGKELEGRPLKINPAEARPKRAPTPRFRQDFNDGPPSFAGGGHGGGRPPGKPKGSRRGLRGKKRSL